MKAWLNDIRKPTDMSLSGKLLYSTLICVAGIVLGVVSKALDETASNLLPYFLEVLDLGNFFSRIGVWIFLAVVISVYSTSPVRSALNVFLFFAGMVGSYYLYTVFIAGFFPKSYMMIWIAMTMISPFMAFVCWYAKGKGTVANFISSIIFLFISKEAFTFGVWFFYIKYILELLLLIAMIFILYQSPKQMIKVITIGLLLSIITSQTNLIWGIW